VSSAAKGARRTLAGLLWILVILYGLLGFGVATDKTTVTPGLALDLAGGRQIILQARTIDGSSIDPGDLKQAVEIIRKRVDASGTAEAEITTQGDRNIVVGLPGEPDESTLDLVRKSAQLQFRPVLFVGAPGPSTPGPEGVDPSASPEPTPGATASPEASQEPERPDATPAPTPAPAVDTPKPTDPSSMDWITPEIDAKFSALDCTDPENLTNGDVGRPDEAIVACRADGLAKLILGPQELTGEDLQTATAGPTLNAQTGAATGSFEVRLDLTKSGGEKFRKVTERLATYYNPALGDTVSQDVRAQFGVLLDGVVITHPQVSKAIPGGKAQITGDFTMKEAQQLANQLKFGAIPLTLDVLTDDHISATKGADELRSGLIAGAIGLLLVVIYSVFQYRALGAVTVGSLLMAGGVSYVLITLLSWGLGYRLSLAGVAGLIVSIGITADSFIVYFERVKDELREGRSLPAAVEHGWSRAKRTIIISDVVSFMAAAVLYWLAVGSVRGFAFTLGLTTLVDLGVVILFTHPTLVLLARTRFFGDGHKWSGLDPRQLGQEAMYKGRGRVATGGVGGGSVGVSDGLTLAERKAARAKAAASSTTAEKE